MTYPEAVDRFVEKLNKTDTVYVIEDEELVLEDGVFEGELAHDNVKNDSVMVFTGPNMTGERIQNFFLSIPSNAPWKRVIKVFSDTPKVYVTYESEGDQVEAEDINLVQESIVNTQKEVERYKAANDQAVQGINVRLTTAENNKAEKTYVDTELLKKADKATTYTKTETDDRIQAIVGAAPEALDTLAEIAEALNNDPDFAATVTNLLAQKVDKVPGKGLSTEDFTTVEKQKLAGIEEDANKYTHPSTHPASMIVETSEKRFVSDIEKAAWNAKETPAGAQAKAVVPNGVLHGGTYTYSNGIFKIQEVTAIIEGEIIYIPSLQISAENDDIIYIRVWEKEITATTVMRAYGNEQGEVIPNYIVDSRVGQETSRRIVLAYDLVKSTELDGVYLKLGKIKSGKFEKEVKEIFKIDELITREEVEGMFIEI